MLKIVVGIMIGWPALGILVICGYIAYRSIRIMLKTGDVETATNSITNEIQSAIEPGNRIKGDVDRLSFEFEVLDNNPEDTNAVSNNRFKNVILWPRMLLLIKAFFDNYEMNKFGTPNDTAG